MFSVGKTLKHARLEQGLDLLDVAAQTKISAKYLEAIESDDRKLLPSGFFYKSFVDQYANYLSLDTREIDAEIDRLLNADEPPKLPGFESVAARNVPSVTLAHRFHARGAYASAASLVLVLVACSGVYGWWRDERSSINLKGIIESMRVLAKPTRGVAKTKSAVKSRAVATSAPVPSVPDSVAPAPVSLASDTKPLEADDYKVMLDLMAREATWLSVSSDGKPVFSGIMQANQTRSVGGKQFAKMLVGNAAGIEVRLNGKPLGTLGAHGQVLTVLFTPDNFQIVATPKESD
jgi:cytoskeletal protein RodZ